MTSTIVSSAGRHRLHTNPHGMPVIGPPRPAPVDLASRWARAWWPLVAAPLLLVALFVSLVVAR